MKLKYIEIKHENYYTDKPTTDRYSGKVAFFNEKGEGLNINLREDQLAGIVDICSAGIVKAAQEAAQSIVASMKPEMQIEHNPTRESSNGN